MSVNVKTKDGLKKLADVTSKETIQEALGYTPANPDDIVIDYNELENAPSIMEDNTGILYIVDEQNNIVAYIDAGGIHTVAVDINGEPALTNSAIENIYAKKTELFNKDYNSLINAPITNEGEDARFIITDNNGNIIVAIDENGLTTTNVFADNLYDKDAINVKIQELKTEIPKDYNDLENAPITQTGDDDSLVIMDNNNNIAIKIDAQGLNASNLLIKGNQVATIQDIENAELDDITETHVREMIRDAIADSDPSSNEYVDSKVAEAKSYTDEKLVEAKEYTDSKTFTKESINTELVQPALAKAKTYTDEKLDNITSLGSSDKEITIVDNNSNIIAKIDETGINTTALYEEGIAIKDKYASKESVENISTELGNLEESTSSQLTQIKTNLNKVNAKTGADIATSSTDSTPINDTINNIKSTYAKQTDLFSKDYNDLTNKPELFSKKYEDLIDAPMTSYEDDSALYIVDKNQVIIATITDAGISTTYLYENGIRLSDTYLSIINAENTYATKSQVSSLKSTDITTTAGNSVEEAINNLSTNKLNKTEAASTYATKTYADAIAEIAQGATKSYVVESQAALQLTESEGIYISALTNLPVYNPETSAFDKLIPIADLHQGDIILIKELDKPDYFVITSSSGLRLSELESRKIKLDDYSTKENTVSSVTFQTGTVTVTKADGTSSTFNPTYVSSPVATASIKNFVASDMSIMGDSAGNGQLQYDTATHTLKSTVNVVNITGNAATANKATQDSSGNNIASTYAKKTELFSGSYTDLSNKPVLFSGDYNDLQNAPIINENEDKTLYIVDSNNNIVAYIDDKGLHAFKLHENGTPVEDKYAKQSEVPTDYIKSLSISGKILTYTLGDGSTRTLTTQDTTYSYLGSNHFGLAKSFQWYSSAVSYGGTINSSPVSATVPTVNNLSSTKDRYYGVESDINGRLFVNVPWASNVKWWRSAYGMRASNGSTKTLTYTSAGLYAIDSKGLVASSANGYPMPGDYIYDPYGSIWVVTSSTSTTCNVTQRWMSTVSWEVCLEEGTLITMADGTYKKIEDVQIGDSIMGYDFDRNEPTEAVAMFANIAQRDEKATYVLFSNGEMLSLTDRHTLYCKNFGRYVAINDLKEGDIVLGKNGEDVEILAIHWNMYGFGHKQFYHITSSNNTYFANNILNAEHPVDRYNWIVNRMNLELPEEIINIIREDSKEYDCFDFTVNDKEFLKEALMYQYQIKKNVNKIDEHKRYLTSTDYIALKYAEGKSVDPTIIVKRQDARDQINILQSKVDMYQTEYNALLTKYSALGTDILLTDNERRAKYFKLACRRDNDSLALFKKYYGVK